MLKARAKEEDTNEDWELSKAKYTYKKYDTEDSEDKTHSSSESTSPKDKPQDFMGELVR